MSEQFDATQSASRRIVSMGSAESVRFLRQLISERQLSVTMKALNREILDGTPGERERALRAVRKLGFD